MAWSAAELAGQLRDLGLGTGDTVLVHSSMRAIGEVSGGAAGVVEAIRRTIGGAGTLMVPTFTEENSKSSRAHTRQVEGLSEQQVEQFRAQMPAFDTAATPSATGWISELVRLTPGAVRSSHPVTSFTALGPEARRLVSGHALDSYHGERSPLGRLNETAGARVLLAGVGYEACSPFHLAEHALPDPPRTTYQFVIDGGGGRHWAAVDSIYLDDSDFPALGAAADAESGLVRSGPLGCAPARVLPMARAVEFAVRWLTEHRRPHTPNHPG